MRPVLSDTLSVLLPTEGDTLLLRACLCSPDVAKEAWRAWLRVVGNPKEELSQRRPVLVHLLPLLHSSIRRWDAGFQSEFGFCVRAAYFREELRSHAYRDILQRVLRTLADEGIEVTVLKGAALAATVYSDWSLRHCHDIDLLLDQGSLAAASRVLQDAGVAQGCGPGRALRDARLLHESGLPIELHADLFGHPFYQMGAAGLADCSRVAEIVGVPTRVLSPAATLLHICGHASYSESRASLRWVTDAWALTARCADLDWAAFLSDARQVNLSLPLHVMLEYLGVGLGVAIPPFVLQTLARDARHVGATAREAALVGVHGDYRKLHTATRDWRSRAFLLRWALLPSPAYQRWTRDARPRSEVFLLHLKQGARFAARRARFALAQSGMDRRTRRPPLERTE